LSFVEDLNHVQSRGDGSAVLLENIYFWNRAHGDAFANWSTLIYLRAKENQVHNEKIYISNEEITVPTKGL
jgi:hypothetical protein